MTPGDGWIEIETTTAGPARIRTDLVESVSQSGLAIIINMMSGASHSISYPGSQEILAKFCGKFETGPTAKD